MAFSKPIRSSSDGYVSYPYHLTEPFEPFRIDKAFVDTYRDLPDPFGFNGLGEIAFLRTYSREKFDGTKERWFETVERVVNGTYTMQKQWAEGNSLRWKDAKAQRSAKEMYDRLFHLKWSPPGRGLWAMGSPITEEKRLYAALNNCAFVSTANMAKRPSEPYAFLMDASMLGVGVGFDTKGANQVLVRRPGPSIECYRIPDSREGWVQSVRLLLDSYFLPDQPVWTFDYSDIRPHGAPIRTFGSVASGPSALTNLHGRIRVTMEREMDQLLSITGVVDIMNHIGVCVVAGNVRVREYTRIYDV